MYIRFVVWTSLSLALHLALLWQWPLPQPQKPQPPLQVSYAPAPAAVPPVQPEPLPEPDPDPEPLQPLPAPEPVALPPDPEAQPNDLQRQSSSAPRRAAHMQLPPPPAAPAAREPRSAIRMDDLLAPDSPLAAAPEATENSLHLDAEELRALNRRFAEDSSVQEAAAPGSETTEQINFGDTFVKMRHVSYMWQMKRRIENVWTYPRYSIENQEQGAVLLRFTLKKDGSLSGVELVRNPSQSAFLANAAMQAVRDATPLPALPDPLERLVINGIFIYHLGQSYIYVPDY